MIVESTKQEDTYAIGKKLGEKCKQGQIYCLLGDLGVGKTVLTKGFAEGLGITEPVNSPTFTILQSYEEGRMPLYHFDVYRIEDPDEMYEIGFEDCFYGNGVCLIEWADRIGELIPPECCKVTIEKDLAKGTEYRRITITNGMTQE